jgi:glyoxylase-like metal-dependent hydrolase (beta-lactamase superfamily II)
MRCPVTDLLSRAAQLYLPFVLRDFNIGIHKLLELPFGTFYSHQIVCIHTDGHTRGKVNWFFTYP